MAPELDAAPDTSRVPAPDAEPFIGPRPFERSDAGVFFGRDWEAQEIASLIIAKDVVLLYGQSGAGKTSLLNALVVPILENSGAHVVPKIRVANPAGVPAYDASAGAPANANLFVLNAVRALQPTGVAASLTDALSQLPAPVDREGDPAYLALILDQFEEVFSSPHQWPLRSGFFADLGNALKTFSWLRVVLSIREDYIAQLEPFASMLPTPWRPFRLERLKREAALLAVSRPVERFGLWFDPEAAMALVDDLMTIRVETEDGSIELMRGEYVEPVQLQVVCQRIWRDLEPGTTLIRSKHIESARETTAEWGSLNVVDQALAQFYEDAIDAVSRECGVHEDMIREWVGDSLLTASATRGLVHRGREQTGGLSNRVPEMLEARHLLTSEWRAGARWYELSHDRFVQPIQASNTRRKQKREELFAKASEALQRVDAMIARKPAVRRMNALLPELDVVRATFESILDVRSVAVVELKKAEIYQYLGDADATISALERACIGFEHAGDAANVAAVLEWAAETCHQHERFDNAVALWTQRLEMEPQNTGALLGRCVSNWYNGRLSEAAYDAQRALDLGVPANQMADALCTYGQLLADLDQPNAATTALLEAIQADHDSTLVSAYARSGLGVAASYRNDREAALGYFEESLKRAPDNAWVYFNRAQVYDRWHEKALARADYEQSLKVSDPSLPPFRRQLAMDRLAELSKSV